MAATCAPTSDCLTLPPTAVRPSLQSHANASTAHYVRLFRARPGDYLPSWGGATGAADRLIVAAKKHAAFTAVVDVGCNTGTWSRSWLGRDAGGGRTKTGMLLCIEALPSLAQSVRKRLDGGGANAELVHVINVALSNQTGEMPLYGLPSSAGKFARAQTGAGLSRTPSEGSHVALGSVQVQTLDHLLRQWRLLDAGRLLVKVDTEGFDVHVLAGAACALRRGAIDVLQIEWNRRKLISAAPPCVSLRRVGLLLELYGYEAFLVGRPFLPINFGFWDEAYEARELRCPPRCTGDVVALRRGMPAREAIRRELLRADARVPARPVGATTPSSSATRSSSGMLRAVARARSSSRAPVNLAAPVRGAAPRPERIFG